MKRNLQNPSPQQGFTRFASKHLFASALIFLGLPGLLPAQSLQYDWSFNEPSGSPVATDSVAGATITLQGSTSLGGGVLTLPGGGGNVAQFPNGILSTNNSITIETWLTDNAGLTWARPWSFGGSTAGPNTGFTRGNYYDLIPHSGPGPLWAEYNHNGNWDAESPSSLPTGTEEYVVVTYDAPSQTGRIFLNGVQVGIATGVTATPASLGYTYNNYIGLDQWNDPVFNGTFDELRIWTAPVSQRYLSASAVAGPNVLINNLTPTTVSVSAGPAVVITGTEQATAYVTLPQTGTNELAASSDATWTSANTNVVTVNSSGLITGVGVGTTTVSASIGGIKSASGNITVSPQALQNRYSFVSDASDSVGGANGTIVPPSSGGAATIANGLSLPGNPGGGNGVSGYVSLPSGLLTNTTSLTVEVWLTQNQANTWATPWDFGNNGSQNFALIPHPGNNNNHTEVAFTPHGNEVDLQSSLSFPNGVEQYVALTYNNSTLVGNLYTNGVQIATQNLPDTSYAPGSIGGVGGTTLNTLGNDVYGDPQFGGTIYEFRIWNGAVTPLYLLLSAAAGPTVVISNTVPQSLNVGLTETSMLGSGTQQASVTGNFIQVSGVAVTSVATKWTTSNTNILTVSSSGLITALSGGSATVSATVNGVTATSAAITVQTTAPTIAQKPANQSTVASSTVVFAVQALGGSLSYQWSFDSTLIPGATNNTLTLTDVSVAQAGTYSVLVSNNLGSTNVSATLTVIQANLLHRYSFVSDASDSVGGANGTLVPPTTGGAATIANGLNLPGNPGGGYGVSGYVSFPSGILTNTASITVEAWVTQNQGNTWAEVWDFGSDNNHNFGFIPFPANNNGNPEVAFTPTQGGELDLQSQTAFPNGTEQYVSLTFNVATLTGNLYTNGVLDATRTFPNATYTPGTIGGVGGTTQNMLGNDVYGDQQFGGTIYEFRIWNGVVSPAYLAISEVAGPSVLVTNTTPQSISVTANTGLLPGSTEQATATGNFLQASGVTVTGFATNWVSSNPNVLTVNSNGVVTAVNSGSATISATVSGVTGTSAAIAVPNSPPVITQQPAAAVSLLAGATFSASVAVIGTAPYTYKWYFNNSAQPINGATSATLTIPSVQLANAGTYTVVVANAYGNVTSAQSVLSVFTPSAYQTSVLSLNPLAYWPLNETSGTVAYDVVGGYNGTYNGNVSLGQAGPSTPEFGSSSLAASFDGSTAYVDIPEGPFNITGAISTAIWINDPYTAGFDGIFGHGDPSWRMSVTPNVEPGANDGTSAANDATSVVPISDGNWHFVVYTYTGQPGVANNGTLYVDGEAVAFNTVLTAPVGDNLDVWIGGAPDYPTARLTVATLANAAVFTYALSANEVQAIYNGQTLPPVTLTIAPSGNNVVLTWPNGTLEQSTNAAGPWTPNPAATSPYTQPTTNALQFYRVQVSP